MQNNISLTFILQIVSTTLSFTVSWPIPCSGREMLFCNLQSISQHTPLTWHAEFTLSSILINYIINQVNIILITDNQGGKSLSYVRNPEDMLKRS
jgi:hypothetical protein